MMNSGQIRDLVGHAAGRFDDAVPENSDLIRQVYLAGLSRPPQEREQARLAEFFATHPDRRQAIEDLIWALINTNEFMFQH